MYSKHLMNPRRFSPFFTLVPSSKNAVSSPPYNVLETADAFQLEMALAGLSKEDISIEIEKDTLLLKANLKNETNRKYLRKEHDLSQFERKFKLSDAIDMAAITAEMKAGILTVNLPKKQEAQDLGPKKIEIQ